MNADDHEAQRDELAAKILKRMRSSYIGAQPPGLRGDAERAVWAVIHEGWQPPVTDALVEYVAARLLDRKLAANPGLRTLADHGFMASMVEANCDEVRWILEVAAKGVPEQEDDHE